MDPYNQIDQRKKDAFARSVRRQMTALKQEFNECLLSETDYHRRLFELRMSAFVHYEDRDHWRADDDLHNARFHAEVVHKLEGDTSCLDRYWPPAAAHCYFTLQREEAVDGYRELFRRSAARLRQDQQDPHALREQQALCVRFGHALLLGEQPVEALAMYRQAVRSGRALHLIRQDAESARTLAESLALELSWSRKLAVEEGVDELLRQREALCERWELSRDLYPHVFEQSVLQPFYERKEAVREPADLATQMMHGICYLNVAAYLAGWIPLSRRVQDNVVAELLWFLQQLNQYDEQFDEESFLSFYQTVEKLLFLLVTVPDAELFYAYSILLRYCKGLRQRDLPDKQEQELLLDLQQRIDGSPTVLPS